jgi:hypothetical protein
LSWNQLRSPTGRGGEELRTNHRDVRQPINRVGPGTLTVDSYPTSESPFDSGGDVIAQFIRSLQCSFDPDNLDLASSDLSGRFAVTSRSRQAALVAGEHAPKNRDRTLLRLSMRTAKADHFSANLGLSESQKRKCSYRYARNPTPVSLSVLPYDDG